MAERAVSVLLDIDGTLVDSNYAHVAAWGRALADLGRPTDAWRIHRVIGMDSARLLEDLLGDEADALGEQAKEAHLDAYTSSASALRPMNGARELMRSLHDRGIEVVLASSASSDELDLLRSVLDSDDVLDDATTDADVEVAKPEPDVVAVALQRSGVPEDRAVLVGDAVWDMQSGTRAGVRCIALRSGGIGASELRAAGADEVYDDPADLLAHLDTSCIARLGAEQAGG